MKTVSAVNYPNDKLFAGVARAVSEALADSNFVAPVDVLIRLGRLAKGDYEDWRFGRIPYLERACVGNLAKLNRTLRILELHCRSLGLIPSPTAYQKWGRGKRTPLRFSKSGDPHLEAAYSRHYVAERKTDDTADESGRGPRRKGAAEKSAVRAMQRPVPLAHKSDKPRPSPGRGQWRSGRSRAAHWGRSGNPMF